MSSVGIIDMPLFDHSAEYYRLREGHERALALAAKTNEQRDQHLLAAARYAALAVGSDKSDLEPAFSRDAALKYGGPGGCPGPPQ
jgi:hypothetical protein